MGIFAGFFAAGIEVEIWIWGLGSRFYKCSVVGDNTYSGNTKMGGAMQCAVTFWEAHIAKISL